MFELAPPSVTAYLRDQGRAAPDGPDLLIQDLAAAPASRVLKIFDPGAGPKVGTDMRSPAQIKRNAPDRRMNLGACYILKQADSPRAQTEHDCLELLGTLLPAGSVPQVLWFDAPNALLALSCAPTDAVLWKKQLLSGLINAEAAQHAGMLLAMLHSATKDEPAQAQRFASNDAWRAARITPWMDALGRRHPEFTDSLRRIDGKLNEKHCLIHGDFAPENVILVRGAAAEEDSPKAPAETVPGKAPSRMRSSKPAFPLDHLLLVDFDLSCFGHPAYDIARLIAELLLHSFHQPPRWRAGMIAIDAFWQTYLHTAELSLVRQAERTAGPLIGALLLAGLEAFPEAIPEAARGAAEAAGGRILRAADGTLETALDEAAAALTPLAE